MNKLKCRCCGDSTIDEYDSYDICSTCGWEDDDLQFDDPDYAGGANDLSLNDHRRKWLESQ